MKIQDAIFAIALLVLLYMRNEKLFIWAGLGSIALSIPLFYTWTFFTAERLTWYGAFFVFAGSTLSIMKLVQQNTNKNI